MRNKIIVSILIGSLIFIVGCSKEDKEKVTGLPETPKTYTVKYSVTGTTNKVHVCYNNKNDGTEMYSDVSVPWEYTFTTVVSRFFLYISAQNEGSEGSVIASIYIDGTLYKTATSEGAYVIASVSGTT